MNRVHLNIKTNLAVFSFLNAFLSFKKRDPKKETKNRSSNNLGDNNI